MNVIKLATPQQNPQKRACSTCRHRERSYGYWVCGATGFMTKTERGFVHSACGMDGKLWEPRSPRAPRRGILTVLRDWLIGGWNGN